MFIIYIYCVWLRSAILYAIVKKSLFKQIMRLELCSTDLLVLIINLENFLVLTKWRVFTSWVEVWTFYFGCFIAHEQHKPLLGMQLFIFSILILINLSISIKCLNVMRSEPVNILDQPIVSCNDEMEMLS